jgi:uncharacterized membrane protein
MNMKKETSLKAIMWISVLGMLFSGFLSYNELFCSSGMCTAAAPINLGLPACVYGLIMYAIVFVLSIIGLKSKN